MDITIKQMESGEEIRGTAYVHWKSWHETYAGLVDQSYLDKLTLEKCTELAFRWTGNHLVAKENGTVIGFAGYGACNDGALPGTGEVFALYVLKEYHGKGVGHALMRAALERLYGYGRIAVWVLEGNRRAVRFYEKCGFRFDGTKKQIKLGTVNTEIRMVLTK